MPEPVPIQTALLSVSDKTDLIAFARRLVSACGTRFVSTGGTARALADARIQVTPVEELTGFPEMMHGRVKTLHPGIHGGLLALRNEDSHVQAMAEHHITPIDLVCVNLYPFEQTVANPEVADRDAVEQIDIGGPSMIRSAAKNHAHVACVTDPGQYDRVCNDIETNGGSTSFSLRRELAADAFRRTAAYDHAISTWMAQRWNV